MVVVSIKNCGSLQPKMRKKKRGYNPAYIRVSALKFFVLQIYIWMHIEQQEGASNGGSLMLHAQISKEAVTIKIATLMLVRYRVRYS